MSDITIRPDDIGTPDVSIKVNVAGGMDGVGIEDITITGGAETDNDGPGGGTGGGTGGITHETDPTVPAWAKQPKKPTYTAEEVGAASKETVDALAEGKADKAYMITLFEQLKELILAGDVPGAVAVLDQAILDNSVLA